MKFFAGLVVLIVSLLSASAKAATLVLIPGFQESGMAWRFQHVTSSLEASGWVDGGNLILTPQGVVNHRPLAKRPKKVVYTLELPNQRSITQQAAVLDHYLRVLAAERKEPLSLVGHSAGGLVGRYWLVTAQSVPVDTLITIATPHLGTPWADFSEVAINTPLAELAASLGLDLASAQPLSKELREERPGNFLYWLNHQPHPAIRYVAIVRNSQRPDSMDLVVPPHSQAMTKVFALQGQTETVLSEGQHFINANDGYRIAAILAPPQLRKK
ncbi:esterase/lipase family protein [Thiothrix eikelboomii]|uniref:esterase/lipase family protein n=1 Tax=Thiothrix eikelboomii TaxID=92487 RepID=UPI003BB02526